MTFKERFQRILHSNEQALYDAFVELSRENLPSDANVRYEHLRSPEGKFIARDEKDVDVYAVKVAGRHKEKFRWLYDKLFTEYEQVFTKDLDIAVWGCGCGLDLLALYDRASAQKNPQLWMKVRHITLVDISEAALSRAQTIAEVLFPMATIDSVVCDLSRIEDIRAKIHLRRLSAYLPRIHLISNVLDLFNDVVPVAQEIMRCAQRLILTESHFNELIVAFSPDYQHGRVAEKIAVFRNTWGTTAMSEDVRTIGSTPLNCEFCAFAYRTLVENRCYRSYMGGHNAVLNRMVALCPIHEFGFNFHGLVTALSRIRVLGHNFYRTYRWVEIGRYGDRTERFVFVSNPDGGAYASPLVLEIGSPREDMRDRLTNAPKRALKCLGKRRNGDVDFDRGNETDFVVLAWNGSQIIDGNGQVCYDLSRICQTDYSFYFRIDPKDAEPLPDLEQSMDDVQREVIYSRSLHRKIRGGAGCGKSTTMMWHAILSVLHTHLPSLLVCKTVTLFNRNKRRMAATLLHEIPGLEYVDNDLFQFKTLDKVLCEHRRDMLKSCVWDRCIKCVGCNHPPISECRDYQDVGRNWRRLDYEEKTACCEVCVAQNVEDLARKGTVAARGASAYGCVMIDEVQSVKPDLVQAVVNLTYGGNHECECYVFCDERQCLNPEAVEIDPEKGKLRVKVPNRGNGYGTWVNLIRPYRLSQDFSGRLADVSARLQALTISKYGAIELARIVGGGQMSFSSEGVFNIRRSTGNLMAEIQDELVRFHQCNRETITIICDTDSDIRSLLRQPDSSDWIKTHCPQRSHDEQQLRMKFRETKGRVHLTSITLAQGWDFENVLFITSAANDGARNNLLENILTGATRAKESLRILDRSASGWLYEILRELNN